MDYVILSLGEDFFKEQSTVSKEFVLYINSPESTAIRSHLNFDPDLCLWYEFTGKDGTKHSGTVKITVTAVKKQVKSMAGNAFQKYLFEERERCESLLKGLGAVR